MKYIKMNTFDNIIYVDTMIDILYESSLKQLFMFIKEEKYEEIKNIHIPFITEIIISRDVFAKHNSRNSGKYFLSNIYYHSETQGEICIHLIKVISMTIENNTLKSELIIEILKKYGKHSLYMNINLIILNDLDESVWIYLFDELKEICCEEIICNIIKQNKWKKTINYIISEIGSDNFFNMNQDSINFNVFEYLFKENFEYLNQINYKTINSFCKSESKSEIVYKNIIQKFLCNSNLNNILIIAVKNKNKFVTDKILEYYFDNEDEKIGIQILYISGMHNFIPESTCIRIIHGINVNKYLNIETSITIVEHYTNNHFFRTHRSIFIMADIFCCHYLFKYVIDNNKITMGELITTILLHSSIFHMNTNNIKLIIPFCSPDMLFPKLIWGVKTLNSFDELDMYINQLLIIGVDIRNSISLIIEHKEKKFWKNNFQTLTVKFLEKYRDYFDETNFIELLKLYITEALKSNQKNISSIEFENILRYAYNERLITETIFSVIRCVCKLWIPVNVELLVTYIKLFDEIIDYNTFYYSFDELLRIHPNNYTNNHFIKLQKILDDKCVIYKFII